MSATIHQGGLTGLAEASAGKRVVIIDVFRAATTACVAFARGASAVIPVAELDELEHLKNRFPQALVLGERKGRPVADSEIGNSPSLLYAAEVRNRIVLHATHAGTRGLLAARDGGALEVWFAGFCNAAATLACLRAQTTNESVLFVPMGWAGAEEAPEDEACAQWLWQRWDNAETEVADFQPIRRQLMEGAASERFHRGDPWAPLADVDLALALDSSPFGLRLEQDAGLELIVLDPKAPVGEQHEFDPIGRIGK